MLLGLIMVATMVPGLLIGLRRTTAIDFDAVAYRTGAILAEDPGWPVFPAWELSNTIDGVDRFGLAVSKDSPGVLSKTKINTFNESNFPIDYPDDYRKRIIFGDYQYQFNIKLQDGNPSHQPIISKGSPLPDVPSYGYIRRLVKIKEYSYAILDLNISPSEHEYQVTDPVNETISQNFTIRLNLSELVDRSINPAYQYDPRIEPINITIINFSATLNSTYLNNNPIAINSTDDNWNSSTAGAVREAPKSANLSSIRFYKNLNPLALPDPINYNFIIDGIPQLNLTPGTPLYNNTTLFIPPGSLPIDEGTILDIRFTFEPRNPPFTFIKGIHNLNYSVDYPTINQPNLYNAWLEVAVW